MSDILQQIIIFVSGGLSGGIVAAIINGARSSRAERTKRKHEFYKEQITKVYGPLYFYVGLTEALFALNENFHKAYNEHFVDRNWSDDQHTKEKLENESDTTLQIANHYVRIARDNNSKIVDILRNNYSYIDPEDAEVFQQFIIDHFRMEREFEADKPLVTPLAVYYKVGEISFSRKEFISLVKKRFAEKKKVIRSIQ